MSHLSDVNRVRLELGWQSHIMEDFQDLVDELSGTTLDGDGTNNNKVSVA